MKKECIGVQFHDAAVHDLDWGGGGGGDENDFWGIVPLDPSGFQKFFFGTIPMPGKHISLVGLMFTLYSFHILPYAPFGVIEP